MKNVFTIDADLPFLDTLAAELWKRTGGDGFLLSQHLILLPTRRSCRMLGQAFARLAKDKPVLLPRMKPLGDVDEDEMAFEEDAPALDLPPALSPLARLMLLAQQVQRRDPAMSWEQAILSAQALARFLDQAETEGRDLGALPKLVEDQEYATHWQKTLAFLEIITKFWPKILSERGVQDPVLRRDTLRKAQAEIWRKAPPAFPIIAAGSTGSVPATAQLLEVIASLPKGAVILPGLDIDLNETAWQEADETHPQYSMKKLLERIGVSRNSVKSFSPRLSPLSARVRLIGEAMLPPSVTHTWRELKLDKEAAAGLSYLTLAHPQEEAQVIALRLREVLETPEKTATLVTADRALATRVAALMERWGVSVNDSGGVPLADTRLGIFLSLLLNAADPNSGNVDKLALLKHPLAACGMAAPKCRQEAREAEIRLRTGQPEAFAKLGECLSALANEWNAPLTLPERIDRHLAAAEIAAASDTERGSDRLWNDGDEATAWFDELRAAEFPSLTGGEYVDLFRALALMKQTRPARETHPRLSILGPLESRLCSADLVILGGLNEGTWPPDVGFDPWMSRPMRRAFDLPSPEYRIGLSAHDFAQLAYAKEVMLTRSARVDGTPTVASRFLLQLDAVLDASGLTHEILEPREPWREWARALDQPAPKEKGSFAPPAPCPPVELRPKALPVTDITTWLRSPYSIYAKHILGLKKLDELDAELDASDRGTMIHEALEAFFKKYPNELPPDAETQLLSIASASFANDNGDPRVRAFWEAQFKNIAGWIIEQQTERIDNGARVVATEIKGKMAIEGLTLTGQPDRIDRLSDGSLSIIDYKTGTVPAVGEVTSGLEPQLPLLALIAASGGFKGIDASAISSCEYWALKGTAKGCKPVVFSGDEKKNKNLPELMSHAEKHLKDLIREFANPGTPYRAVPKLSLQKRYDDYAHLARVDEWIRRRGI